MSGLVSHASPALRVSMRANVCMSVCMHGMSVGVWVGHRACASVRAYMYVCVLSARLPARMFRCLRK